eukprot:TRINITY_DN5209_c0_g4_i1.p1 TRINITY_DN5209_c0_g4~~TRINITY_DN5209_c0_g4_i1.p1  ORF type:complete len:134 (+),score=4.51 TRINITY_DN5209_c0_g4_i1:347-748(+)
MVKSRPPPTHPGLCLVQITSTCLCRVMLFTVLFEVDPTPLRPSFEAPTRLEARHPIPPHCRLSWSDPRVNRPSPAHCVASCQEGGDCTPTTPRSPAPSGGGCHAMPHRALFPEEPNMQMGQQPIPTHLLRRCT